jgi:hypothetical protein
MSRMRLSRCAHGAGSIHRASAESKANASHVQLVFGQSTSVITPLPSHKTDALSLSAIHRAPINACHEARPSRSSAASNRDPDSGRQTL